MAILQAFMMFVKNKVMDRRTEYSGNNAWNLNTNTDNNSLNNNNKNNNNNNNRVRAFCELSFWVDNVKKRLMEEKIPLEDFFKAYYDCRKHKRRTHNQIEFEIDFERKLIELCKEVNERRYKIGKSICFCVTRPKLREVFAADFRDRIIHHVIMQRLEPIFENEFIEDNYNCRKGKGVLYGIHRLKEKMRDITDNYSQEAYVAKFDIKAFFMTIDKRLLLSKVEKLIEEKYDGKDKGLLKYLVGLVINNAPQDNCERRGDVKLWQKLPKEKSLFTTDEGKGLPIGNLTSQMFGNFYLNEMDKWLTDEFDGCYGRYVDDFYIMSKDKDKIKNIIPRIRNYLKEVLGVTLHKDKVYLQPVRHGVKFTGYCVKYDRVYTGNATKANMIDAIIGYNAFPSKEKAECFRQTLNSYMGFLSHTKSYAIKRNIFNMINPMWWDYLKIEGDFKKVSL